MGIAIRHNIQLNLNLAPTIWKIIVEQPLTLQDLASIDQATVALFNTILEYNQQQQHQHNHQTTTTTTVDTQLFQTLISIPEMFGIETFTTTLSDGVTSVELHRHGAQRAVNSGNCAEWVTLCQRTRLHESDAQVNAMRAGLSSIIPATFWWLFTGPELESLVCGSPDLSISVLRSVTKYEGSQNESLPHVQSFWRVMESFTPAQKSQFLRFAWARTRAPKKAADFSTKFKMQVSHVTTPHTRDKTSTRTSTRTKTRTRASKWITQKQREAETDFNTDLTVISCARVSMSGKWLACTRVRINSELSYSDIVRVVVLCVFLQHDVASTCRILCLPL